MAGERKRPAGENRVRSPQELAALLGTMAANAFYLTLSFFYFFVFCAIALATPIVFGRSLTTAES